MAVQTISAAELRYAHTMAAVDVVAKDEQLRKMRLQNVVLNHDLGEANDKFRAESERADQAEQNAEYWEDIAKSNEQKLEQQATLSKSKARELDNLRAELSSLQTVSCDSANLLTEKLALSRELANLKPELEHLRSQVASNENLFAEKLALKRLLATCQAELDAARRDLQTLESKEDKANNKNATHNKEIQDLEKELAKLRREKQNADKTAQSASQEELDELRKELAKEKLEREKAERDGCKSSNDGKGELAKLKKELASERLEHQKAQRQTARSEAEWEAQKALLDDKLDQFRVKLRSTKESLKDARAELEQARASAPAVTDIATTATTNIKPPRPDTSKTRTSRKRSAVQMDPDVAIGTPGDAPQNKRARRTTASTVGEKSTFSITPFLGRRTSVAPDSPASADAQAADVPVQTIEAADSPSAHKSKPVSASPKKTAKKIPLAPASPGKSNLKIKSSSSRKKIAARTTLEKVTEEEDDANTTHTQSTEHTTTDFTTEAITEPATTVAAAATTSSSAKKTKPARLSLKPKSLSSFATFREGSLPPQQLSKKKRKLGGSAPKTIFDEDEEAEEENGDGDDPSAGTFLSTSGKRAFGALGGSNKLLGSRGLGLLAAGVKKKGPLVVANDGFMFSPLKKDRKRLAAATAAAVEA